MEEKQLICILVILAVVLMIVCIIFIKYRTHSALVGLLSAGNSIQYTAQRPNQSEQITGGCVEPDIDVILNKINGNINVFDLTNMAVSLDRALFFKGFMQCKSRRPTDPICRLCTTCSRPRVPYKPANYATSVNIAYLYMMYYYTSTNVFVYKDLFGNFSKYFGPKMTPIIKYSPIDIQPESEWNIHFDINSTQRDQNDQQVSASAVKLCSMANYSMTADVVLANFVDTVSCSLHILSEKKSADFNNVNILIGSDMNLLNDAITIKNSDVYNFTTYDGFVNIANVKIGDLPVGGCVSLYPVSKIPELLFKLLFVYMKKTERLADYKTYKFMLDICRVMSQMINTNQILRKIPYDVVKYPSADLISIFNMKYLLNDPVGQNNSVITSAPLVEYQKINDTYFIPSKDEITQKKKLRDASAVELSQIKFHEPFKKSDLIIIDNDSTGNNGTGNNVNNNINNVVFDFMREIPKLLVDKDGEVYDLILKTSDETKTDERTYIFNRVEYKLVKSDKKITSGFSPDHTNDKLAVNILLGKIMSCITNKSMFVYTEPIPDPVYISMMSTMYNDKSIGKSYHWIKGYDDFTTLFIYTKLLNNQTHLVSLDYFLDWPVYNLPSDKFVKSHDAKNPSAYEFKYPNNAAELIRKKYTEQKKKGAYISKQLTCIDEDFKFGGNTLRINTTFKDMNVGEPMHLPEYKIMIYTFGKDSKVGYEVLHTCNINSKANPFKKYIGLNNAAIYMNVPNGINRSLLLRNYR